MMVAIEKYFKMYACIQLELLNCGDLFCHYNSMWHARHIGYTHNQQWTITVSNLAKARSQVQDYSIHVNMYNFLTVQALLHLLGYKITIKGESLLQSEQNNCIQLLCEVHA